MNKAQGGELDLSVGKAWACMAEMQTAGKGRRGRVWVSPFGHNLYLSLVREFSNGAAALDGLSLVVGLALVTALEAMGYKGARLKWPNDVLLDNRKLAGILLEVSGDMTGQCHVVIGLGVNLRSEQQLMTEVDQPWIALDQLGYKQHRRNEVCAHVLKKLLNALHMFEHSGFTPFIRKWAEYDITFGQHVSLVTAGGAIEGVGRGLTENGALKLETVQGLRTFHGGEVSLRVVQSPDSEAEM